MYFTKAEIETARQALDEIKTFLDKCEQANEKFFKRNGQAIKITEKQKANFENQRKLTDFEVKAIKHLYSTGKYSMRDLGAKYNVSRQTICDIVREKTRYLRGDV